VSKGVFVSIPICDITVYESLCEVDNQCGIEYNTRVYERDYFDDLSFDAVIAEIADP